MGNIISASALLGTKEIKSSFDFVYLVYMQAALQQHEQGGRVEVDYTGMTCTFTFEDLKKSKYISLLMMANEKGYFATMPEELELFEESFEDVMGEPYVKVIEHEDSEEVSYINYTLPAFIFDPWAHADYDFQYKPIELSKIPEQTEELSKFKEAWVYNLLDRDLNRGFVFNPGNFETGVLWSVAKHLSHYALTLENEILHCYVIPLTMLQTNYPIPLLSYLVLENSRMKAFVNLAFEKDILPLAQLGYLTWEAVGLDLGLIKHHMDRDKLEYTQSKYKVGDTVLLYQRKVADIKKSVSNKLIGCKIGVVRAIKPEGVEFEHINTRDTRLTTEHKFSNFSDEVQDLYRHDKDLGIRVTKQLIRWRDLGVDFYLSNDAYFEEFFFTPLSKNDSCEQYVKGVDGKPEKKVLDYYTIINTILDDYSMTYDKARFKEQYGSK